MPCLRGLAASPYLLGLPFLVLMAVGASPGESNPAGRASLALCVLLVVVLFLNCAMHLARALNRLVREPAARRAYLNSFVSGLIFAVWAVLTASWLARTI
jgi:protein-S-isoprenylcysteine O-methyltransferase Ste14